VIEHEGDGIRVQPGIEGIQYRANHGRTKMQLHHRRNVRQHDGHGVAAPNTMIL
jgi:hypothetical protein